MGAEQGECAAAAERKESGASQYGVEDESGGSDHDARQRAGAPTQVRSFSSSFPLFFAFGLLSRAGGATGSSRQGRKSGSHSLKRLFFSYDPLLFRRPCSSILVSFLHRFPA